MTESHIRKATTPDDITPQRPPCPCSDPEREFGHNRECVFGPLRFLVDPQGEGLPAAAGKTRIVTRGFMDVDERYDRYHYRVVGWLG